jgi:hypothetical protein
MSSKTCGVCERGRGKSHRKEKKMRTGRMGGYTWTRKALIIAAAAAGEEGMRV